MMRKYNRRISVKANIEMNRRARKVRLQRRLIAIAAVLVVSLALLFGTGIKIFARSGSGDAALYKYYTSIPVEPGDTLWEIARQYTAGTDVSMSDYIEEIRDLNHLSSDNIISGKNIVISYYSEERK